MKVALTFDIERDIPNVLDSYFGVKVGLSKILALLDKFSLKCTFFCTGTVVKKFPEYIRSIEDKGHEIACHGLNHERLNKLTFNECQELIAYNRNILKETCQNSEIIGFRAPYLKPPKFLFAILHKLGFKYDSSIKSRKNPKLYKTYSYKIQEFTPLNISLRLPIGYFFLKNLILKKEIIILYFHPSEVIDIKSLMLNENFKGKLFKDYLIRPDRWIKTGDSFLIKIENFIKEALSRKAEFVTIKQLIE
ncbi:MAG: polysaccharide deacetylase family protein [Promethearchaeota archaeon]